MAEEYKLGPVAFAYLVAGPICLLIFMPLSGRPLLQFFGFFGYVKVNETLQLAGMCFVSGPSRVVCGTAFLYFVADCVLGTVVAGYLVAGVSCLLAY